jgi:hypothetical protein
MACTHTTMYTHVGCPSDGHSNHSSHTKQPAHQLPMLAPYYQQISALNTTAGKAIPCGMCHCKTTTVQDTVVVQIRHTETVCWGDSSHQRRPQHGGQPSTTPAGASTQSCCSTQESLAQIVLSTAEHTTAHTQAWRRFNPMQLCLSGKPQPCL